MTTPQQEQELDARGRRIAAALTRGLDRLPPDKREQLKMARQAALDGYEPALAARPAFAWATQFAGFGGRRLATWSTVAGMLLALGTVGVLYNGYSGNDDDTDTEMSLLTGELPINAYLDNGFDEWLKRSSQ